MSASVQVLTMTVPPHDAAAERAADAFVRGLCDAKQTYCLGGTLKYELPCSGIALSEVFEKVDDAIARGLPLTDWGVHNASLEDVFIRLAAKAEGGGAIDGRTALPGATGGGVHVESVAPA